MKSVILAASLALVLPFGSKASELRLIALDPAHSHAAQVFVTMLPGFSPEVHVYAPLGPGLTSYLNSVARFNERKTNPTEWSFDVYAGADYLKRMLREPPGNVVVMSGRNQRKIDDILACIRAGQNVLADKPWIIDSRDLPKLETALNLADSKGLAAYDCMTQRFDVAYQIQRALVNDREVFGDAAPGTAADPAVRLENLHALLKFNGAVPSHRPAWYFDIRQQGEGMADVGTHLVDLVFWTLFADQAIDYRRDLQVLKATRTPLVLTREQFERVTGEKAWPDFVRNAVKDDQLEYYTNNTALFTVRGVHVFLRVQWQYEAPSGVKDSYLASFRGTRATVRLREGKAENFIPEVDVIPNSAGERAGVLTALRNRFQALNPRYPGLSLQETGTTIRIVIPTADRTPDANYFALLVDRFLGYVHNPKTLPPWEKANMMAKYYITTTTVDVARGAQP
ncbi:MAG: putative oxidoreductase C-terminal domain-containing protein [Bryobacteraceae bacterium]